MGFHVDATHWHKQSSFGGAMNLLCLLDSLTVSEGHSISRCPGLQLSVAALDRCLAGLAGGQVIQLILHVGTVLPSARSTAATLSTACINHNTIQTPADLKSQTPIGRGCRGERTSNCDAMRTCVHLTSHPPQNLHFFPTQDRFPSLPHAIVTKCFNSHLRFWEAEARNGSGLAH